MVTVPTTRMSSRGQVVIPEAIRIGCGFGEGIRRIRRGFPEEKPSAAADEPRLIWSLPIS